MNIKEAIKRNWKTMIVSASIIISIVILLLIAYYQLEITEQNYLIGQKLDEKEYKFDLLKELPKDSIIVQEFIAKYDNLEKIGIGISVESKSEYLDGNVNIVLEDENGNILEKETVKYDILSVKSNHEFCFKQINNSKGKKYILKLELDENISNAVSLKSSKNSDENKKLYLNENNIDGSIFFVDKYNSTKRTTLFNITAVIVAILVFVISMVIYVIKKLTPEKAFLIIVPILSILFIIYMPMFRANDEYRHWLRAYEISEGHLMTEINNGVVGTELPTSVKEIFIGWRNIRYDDTIKHLDMELNSDKREIIEDLTYTASYSPIQYIPSTSGIMLARIFTDKVMVMAYMARITNLICCIAIMFIAIKTIPFGKKILLLISIFPMTIQGISTISADGITISMSFFALAYILKLKFGNIDKINIKHKIVLTTILAVLALCKIIYVLFLLMILMLPNSRFKNKKDKIITIISIGLIVTLISVIWLAMSSKYSETNISNQLRTQSVIQNPIEYLKLQLYSMNYEGETYFSLTFGGELGWGRTVNLYALVPYTIFCMCFAICILDNKIKYKLDKLDIIIFAIIILAIVSLAFLAMYITYTPWDYTNIKGVQGRYFIPVLPLLFLGIGSFIKTKSEYKEENLVKFISIVTMILELNIILSMVLVHLK